MTTASRICLIGGTCTLWFRTAPVQRPRPPHRPGPPAAAADRVRARPRAPQVTGWSASRTPMCTRMRRRPCSRWWSARRSRAWPAASAPLGPPRTTGSSCRAAPSALCTVRRPLKPSGVKPLAPCALLEASKSVLCLWRSAAHRMAACISPALGATHDGSPSIRTFTRPSLVPQACIWRALGRTRTSPRAALWAGPGWWLSHQNR